MDNNENIEKKLVDLLKKNNLVISTAESCTGGLIGAAIVNVSGASAVYHKGYITYSNEAKMEMLGVSDKTLDKYYAVSKETAYEMALGCAKKSNADVSVAVTGVAGPSMEDNKPVGLVYISCFYNENVTVKEFMFSGNREQIRKQAAQEALKLVISIIS